MSYHEIDCIGKNKTYSDIKTNSHVYLQNIVVPCIKFFESMYSLQPFTYNHTYLLLAPP